MRKDHNYLLLILIALDFIWVRSSIGKIIGGEFVDSLGGVLTKFASQNPYPWYKSFLTSVAIPNFSLFGTVIMLGETFAAFSLLFGIGLLFFKPLNKPVILLVIAGLITGALLNLNFWLASGWTSPSADSLNLLMMLIEVVGIVFFVTFLRKEQH